MSKIKKKVVEGGLDGLVARVIASPTIVNYRLLDRAINKFDNMGYDVNNYKGIYTELMAELPPITNEEEREHEVMDERRCPIFALTRLCDYLKDRREIEGGGK